MPSQTVRTQTRFKPDLHAWLVDRAKQNNRSFNGELVDILQKAKEAEQTYCTACHESGIEPIINPTEK